MVDRAKIGEAFVEVSADLKKLQEGFDRANAMSRKSLQNIGRGMRDAGKRATMLMTVPIVAMGAGILRTAGNFEQAMNQVQAVSGATGKEFEALRAQARQLGETTQFSANQAAGAMGFLAQAGFTANEIISAMPGTLRLAAAAQMDLATAADIVSNVLAGYQMEVSDLDRVNDILVKSFTSANTNLQQLGEAMKAAGPTASAMGFQFEEIAAAIGILGQSGIQGERAGTALRNMFLKVATASPEATRAMEDFGLKLKNADGSLKSVAGQIAEFELALKAGHSQIELTNAAFKIFDVRAGPAFVNLWKKGSAALMDFTEALEDSGGTAKRVADVQMKGFNGQMRALVSALEGLALAIADSGLLTMFTDLARDLASFVRELSKTNPEILKMGTIIAGAFAVGGPVLIGLGFVVTALSALLTTAGLVAAGMLAAGGLIAAMVIFRKELSVIGGRLTDEFITKLRGIADAYGAMNQAIADSITRKAGGIVESFSAMTREIVNFAQAMFEGVRMWIGEKLVAILESIKGPIDDVIGYFEEMWHDVVGGSFVPDMVEEILAQFDILKSRMPASAEFATDHVSDAFENMAARTSRAMRSFGADLLMGEASVGGFMRSIQRMVLEAALSPFGNAIQGIIQGVGQNIAIGQGFFPDFAANAGSIPTPTFRPPPAFHLPELGPPMAGGGFLGAGRMAIAGEGGEPELIHGPAGVTPFSELGGGGVVVNVINGSGSQVETREGRSGDGRKVIDVLVNPRVARDIEGRGVVARAMETTYGLSRRGRA